MILFADEGLSGAQGCLVSVCLPTGGKPGISLRLFESQRNQPSRSSLAALANEKSGSGLLSFALGSRDRSENPR